MDNNEKQIEFIKNTLKQAYLATKKCHDLVFEDGERHIQDFKASIYLSQAVSLMSSCKSVYYSNFEFLANIQLEDIFFTFDVFVREISNNISTGHSHQWTDIEFENYKNTLDGFADIILK